jgi:hypothetical protein
MIEIVIDGTVVGELDPETVSLAHQVELEEQKTVSGIVRWLEVYANGNREVIIEVLSRLRLGDGEEVGAAIGAAMAEAARVPKANGASSAGPSQPVARGRRGGPSASTTPSAGTSPRGSSPKRR